MRWALAVGSLVCAAFAFQDRGPKIADVTEFSGTVRVQRGEQALDVGRVARRIRNGDLYDSDQVSTQSGSTAAILFADATRIDVQEATQLAIEQRRLQAPTEAGKTIGRRIRILTGRIVSDVVPSDSVQTDFVTPAGTAAVRGTVVGCGVNGMAADVDVHNGAASFHQPGGQGQWQMADGANAQFTYDPATNTMTIDNNGRIPLEGQLGSSPVTVGEDGTLILHFGDTGFTCDPDGTVTEFNEASGQFEPMPEGEQIPFAEEPVYSDVPLVDASAGGTTEEPPPSDESLLTGGTGTAGGDIPPPTDTATILGTTGGGFSSVIDDFNRADDPLIGNGWIENPPGPGADPSLLAGEVLTTLGPMGGLTDNVHIANPIGNLATFDIQADFLYNPLPGNLEFILMVNGDSTIEQGMKVEYYPSGSLIVADDMGNSNFVGATSILPNDPFTLRLAFDGSTLTGSLVQSGSTLDTVSTPAVNFGCTDVLLGAHNFDAFNHTVHFDNVIRNQ